MRLDSLRRFCNLWSMRCVHILLVLAAATMPAPAYTAGLENTWNPQFSSQTRERSAVRSTVDRSPRFEEYPIQRLYKGPGAPARIVNKEQFAFRTRIGNASRGPVNFAGHYRFDTWGCGTSCLQGAVVDLVTGEVTMMPFSVCCYYGNGDMATYQATSRLVVFKGLRNEEGIYGRHYYKFENGAFIYLLTIAEDKNQHMNGEEPIVAEPSRSPNNPSPALATAIAKEEKVNKLVIYQAECGEDYHECVVADLGCSDSEGFFANVFSFDDKAAAQFISTGERTGILQIGSKQIELKAWRLDYSDMNGDWDISLRLEKGFDKVWKISSVSEPVSLMLGSKKITVPTTVASNSNFKEIVRSCLHASKN